MSKMENFYFTFGQSHSTKEGELLKDYWVRVTTRYGYEHARQLFIDNFAELYLPSNFQWSFQYTEDKFDKEYYPKGEYFWVKEYKKKFKPIAMKT